MELLVPLSVFGFADEDYFHILHTPENDIEFLTVINALHSYHLQIGYIRVEDHLPTRLGRSTEDLLES
ncbi:hypothetical protein GJ744_007644 [Endocarpon pusillum]|uniref:Uncharacterized protein n=1 Tax=Endocarpon pusillum TaxID=364733 RepID=A0A8H7E7D5_9EURO|nr:hypothetical protein GJ744_007644 [Endocarpon pusillum]